MKIKQKTEIRKRFFDNMFSYSGIKIDRETGEVEFLKNVFYVDFNSDKEIIFSYNDIRNILVTMFLLGRSATLREFSRGLTDFFNDFEEDNKGYQ